MSNNAKNDYSDKKEGKKVPVLMSDQIDPDVAIELLSLIYEGTDLELISFEKTVGGEDWLISSKDPIETMIIDEKSEIITPMIPLFQSEHFVLDYHRFY